MFSSCPRGFPPTVQRHAGRLIRHSKLLIGMSV
uniref:Uncharacterized protein n=1 Tax=Anguilla anguilla TaxID=7936 RepID=A0A0E9P8U5_ANGAN